MCEWHEVNSKKDLPRKSGDILIASDLGVINVAYWDAHKKVVFVSALRNAYDEAKRKRVLVGQFDYYALTPWRDEKGSCAAWCEIPTFPKDWEK